MPLLSFFFSFAPTFHSTFRVIEALSLFQPLPVSADQPRCVPDRQSAFCSISVWWQSAVSALTAQTVRKALLRKDIELSFTTLDSVLGHVFDIL